MGFIEVYFLIIQLQRMILNPSMSAHFFHSQTYYLDLYYFYYQFEKIDFCVIHENKRPGLRLCITVPITYLLPTLSYSKVFVRGNPAVSRANTNGSEGAPPIIPLFRL